MPWFRPIFLIKIVSVVFEIFRKKEAKKKSPLFSCTITILDHILLYKIEVSFWRRADKWVEWILIRQSKVQKKRDNHNYLFFLLKADFSEVFPHLLQGFERSVKKIQCDIPLCVISQCDSSNIIQYFILSRI